MKLLTNKDPEETEKLKAALAASLQTLDEPPPVVDASDPRNEENEQLFRAAVAGAECGNVTPVRAYIDVGGSLDRRITVDDASALKLSSSVPKSSLLDVALHRSQTNVVMELLGETEGGVPRGSSDAVSTLRRRRLSEDLEEQATHARNELRGRMRQRSDGLIYVDGLAGTFAMPTDLSLPAVTLYAEGQAENTAICEALSSWNSEMADRGHGLVTIYTPGDLNCLLHAASLCLSGASDRPLTAETRGSLLPWEVQTEPLGALRGAVAASLRGCAPLRRQVCSSECDAEKLADIAATDRTSPFREHVSALASVLRRVIIVYAPSDVEVRTPLSVENRMFGVYLPLLWTPEQCEGMGGPIAVAYTKGHFSAIVRGPRGRQSDASSISLADEQDGWCEWQADEAGLYLPLQDDEGLPLPIGPPWALQQTRAMTDDTAALPHVTTCCSSSGVNSTTRPPLLPDLLGYEAVEQVVLPSGMSVPCCVQLSGGLRGDYSGEIQRLARAVMESQAHAHGELQQERSSPQLGTQVSCDTDDLGMSL